METRLLAELTEDNTVVVIHHFLCILKHIIKLDGNGKIQKNVPTFAKKKVSVLVLDVLELKQFHALQNR